MMLELLLKKDSNTSTNYISSVWSYYLEGILS